METPNNIQAPQQQKPLLKIWRFMKRSLLYSVITIILSVTIGVLLVFIYEDDVKTIIIKELNKHLHTEVRIEPQNIDLTIISSFPYCALEFKNLTALDAKGFKSQDTLLYAEQLALSFSIKDLFHKNYSIKKITLSNAHCYLKEDKKGNKNYLVWKGDSTSTTSNEDVTFALEKIVLSQVKLIYKSNRQKIKINCHIKQLDFKGNFSNDNYLLASNGKLFVNEFVVDGVNYIAQKNLQLALELDVSKNTYNIKKAETTFNATELVSSGSFVIDDSLTNLDIFYKAKNLDIASTLSLLPDKFQHKISDYKSNGEFYATGEMHYAVNAPFSMHSDFGIKNGTITYKPQNTTLSNVNLTGSIVINKQQSELHLNHITANLNSNSFAGNVMLKDFENPYLKLDIEASTKLEELMAFYPIDTLQAISGNIAIKAQVEGLLSELKNTGSSQTVKTNGEATLLNIKAQFKQSEKEINIPEGRLTLKDKNIEVTNLKLLKGQSDVSLTGELPNFMTYLFDTKSPLTINANLQSNHIEIEDFLFASSASNSSANEVKVPDNIELNVNCNVSSLTFGKLKAHAITGGLLLKNQKMALKNVDFTTADGFITLNVFADASGKNIEVSGTSDMKQLNIQQLFSQLNNFGQTTLEDKNLKGQLTATTDFKATWNKQLQIDLSSIKASSNILIERGELLNFKPLESLAKYIDVNELKQIKFSTLQSTIDIQHQLISIPKTSIKSSVLNLELWGTHSFDNVLDYHIQLLMSELLAKRKRSNPNLDEELSLVENDPENRRSVFILMTGPVDNMKIKYDRKGAKEKIKQDIQQEKQNIKQLLKEEFGLFKKDSIKQKPTEKANQKFNLQIGEEPNKLAKPLVPKKKEEDDF